MSFCELCDSHDEGAWSGWYGDHDGAVHDRIVAIEKALDHILDAWIGPDGWVEDDVTFWVHRLHELERTEP